MPHLTKRIADAQKPNGCDRIIFDDALPGFGLRVKATGARSWLVQYKRAGRTRRITFGRFPSTTAEIARQRAMEELCKVQGGGDPSGDRKAALREPTVATFAEYYLERHAEVKKKSASVRNDRLLLRLHVLPKIGPMKMAAVTPADVARLHHGLRKTPYAANRTVSLLSKMFAVASACRSLPPGHPNPAAKLDRFPEAPRQRPLTLDEVRRFGAALAAAERERTELPGAILAARLLLLSGCRLSEILSLAWSAVDFEGAALVLADSKTGPRRVPIGAAVVQVLREADTTGSPWVCPGLDPSRPLVGFRKPFLRLCRRAGIDGARVHDLRHTVGSIGASSGLSLKVLGAVLGHRESRTTNRYATLVRGVAHEAADRIANTLAAALDGRPDAVVVALGRRA